MLIDTARIRVKAGDGGNGCKSFRREKFVPFGGPNGGDGGRGGSIVIEASRGHSTLLDFRYKREIKAERGHHGLGSRKTGRSGEGVVLKVPVGTMIKDVDIGEILADLDEVGKSFVVAAGGRGGRGNARFATSTNRAPTRCEEGRPGEERMVELELKLVADVGLVGLPNAGKSTLLSTISAARPKIGSFPFTTLSPVLGLVPFDIDRSFVVADLPGLIEGAHQGKGLGDRFLRHIERTRVLVVLVDSSDPDPEVSYRTLLHELRSYGFGVSEKPRIVALTKMDLGSGVRSGDVAFGGEDIVEISSATGAGLEKLKGMMRALLDEADRTVE
jgi:GTP-binding protein